jgi:hypothetical protein
MDVDGFNRLSSRNALHRLSTGAWICIIALGMLVADLFKSRSRLEAEILFLRHQFNLALRRVPPRAALRGSDRAFMV